MIALIGYSRTSTLSCKQASTAQHSPAKPKPITRLRLQDLPIPSNLGWEGTALVPPAINTPLRLNKLQYSSPQLTFALRVPCVCACAQSLLKLNNEVFFFLLYDVPVYNVRTVMRITGNYVTYVYL